MHVLQGWSEYDNERAAEYEHDDVDGEDADSDSDNGVGAQNG